MYKCGIASPRQEWGGRRGGGKGIWEGGCRWRVGGGNGEDGSTCPTHTREVSQCTLFLQSKLVVPYLVATVPDVAKSQVKGVCNHFLPVYIMTHFLWPASNGQLSHSAAHTSFEDSLQSVPSQQLKGISYTLPALKTLDSYSSCCNNLTSLIAEQMPDSGVGQGSGRH
ncbi:hypothetical protein E2C01_035912 [Portunus trituberculatus]|uniref:Uncharacterized protein n=1 Tax=Portunus trituberculatus TaxID=210409 RepID=A0A5B7FB02_PORTR|nr:hypothetical protein [Portunus trituberculatus]